VVTSYTSQAKTVDQIILSVPVSGVQPGERSTILPINVARSIRHARLYRQQSSFARSRY
jgi:hypothetical protein